MNKTPYLIELEEKRNYFKQEMEKGNDFEDEFREYERALINYLKGQSDMKEEVKNKINYLKDQANKLFKEKLIDANRNTWIIYSLEELEKELSQTEVKA